MTLVDSSSWIEALRPNGRREVKRRVYELLNAGEARWCDVVRLELWRGVKGRAERAVLEDLEAKLLRLETPAGVWESAIELMKKSLSRGLTPPPTDVLIVCIAAHHQADIEHCDKHIDALLALR